MSNEEAIKILSYTSNLGYGIIIEAMEGYTTRDINIALDMAIEALEEKMPQGEKQNEEIKNRLNCLDEIIAYMKDDNVIWRDVSDDVIIDILKKYNLYDVVQE